MTCHHAISSTHPSDGDGKAVDSSVGERTILHADLDAFFASVEQRDHPQWRGKPVVVGAAPDQRGVVAAASYEARRFGIRSAMPSRQAGSLCPEAIFVPPDMRRYQQASQAVFACFERFTPLIEPLSIDEAFLDVTGSRRLFGDGRAIARQLKQTVLNETGLIVSIGVAPNKFLAKLASEHGKPDGLVVTPREPAAIRAFLAPLPVGCLWGAGPDTVRRLDQAGAHDIGDLQRMSHAALTAIVGAHAAAHFKALSEGYDPRDVIEDSVAEKSLSRETTFARDCEDPDTVTRTLMALVDDVGARLRRRQWYAASARLKIRYHGFQTLTRRRRLPRPCRDDTSLRAAAAALLREVPLDRPVRLVGFGVAELTAGGEWQPLLFGDDVAVQERRERISDCVDAVRNRFGRDAVRRADQAPMVRSAGGSECSSVSQHR